MRPRVKWAVLVLATLASCRQAPPRGTATAPLPDGRPGIGFDDLQFSKAYGVVGHDQGATSVADGAGLLFVTDRTTKKVYVADPKAKRS